MTTLQHTPPATSSNERRLVDVAPHAASAVLREQSTVCLAWTICPRALRAASPAASAALSDGTVEPAAIALEIQIDFRAKTAQALLRAARPDGPRTHALAPPARFALTPDPLNGFLHIDAPGILRATLALDERTRITGVIYAATPILAALALPGGVCDAPSLA